MTSDAERTLTRRDLFKAGAAVSALGIGASIPACTTPAGRPKTPPGRPVRGLTVLASTWRFGLKANEAGLAKLKETGSSLDAVEAGVRVVEADPNVSSVGFGGIPNRDGEVELDASIMHGPNLRCGGVAALQGIMHPVSVARRVMERTKHVLLVGAGARKFALDQGFKLENLLTDKAREVWQKRLQSEAGGTPGSAADHDTIGMMALDPQGRISAAVTTSGLGMKLPGRVGDSPLVGCGLYADNEAGACVSTGVGEEAIRVLGSFLTVELMRRGADPLAAAMETLGRVRRVNAGRDDFQLAFLAMSLDGEVAGAALQKGFQFALSDGRGRHELVNGEVL